MGLFSKASSKEVNGFAEGLADAIAKRYPPAMDAAEALPKAPPPDDADLILVAIDRVAPDRVAELQIPKGESAEPEPSRIISSRWLE